jgi:hypothetical protein
MPLTLLSEKAKEGLGDGEKINFLIGIARRRHHLQVRNRPWSIGGKPVWRSVGRKLVMRPPRSGAANRRCDYNTKAALAGPLLLLLLLLLLLQ